MRRKLHIDKFQDKVNKGFTLVEVLAVVVIISVVLGIGFMVYNRVIENSKAKSESIALNNLKEAAEIYAKEGKDVVWNSVKQEGKRCNIAYEYSCITVNQLINYGYFDRKIIGNDYLKVQVEGEMKEITENSYILLKRDSDSKAIFENSIDILGNDSECNQSGLDMVDDCEDSIKLVPERYTDRIFLSYTVDEKVGGTYECIGDSSFDNQASNGPSIKQEEENNQCQYLRLKKATSYKKIGVSLLENGSVISTKTTDQTTLDFDNPSIKIEKNQTETLQKQVDISFSNKNIYEQKGYHYFKSDVDGTLRQEGGVYVCDSEDAVLKNSCKQEIEGNLIEAGKWYCLVGGTDVSFVIKEGTDALTKKKIYAKTQDSSKNSSDLIEKEIGPIADMAPTCTIYLNGGTDYDKIYGEEVSITLEASENATSVGLVDSETVHYNGLTSAVQKEDTTGVKWYGYVKNEKGKAGTCEAIVRKTTSIPTCNISLSGTKKWNDYYVSDVNITLDTNATSYKLTTSSTPAYDGTSKTAVQNQDTTNKAVTWYGYVQDSNGLMNRCSVEVKRDTVLPSCKLSNIKSLSKDYSNSSTYTSGEWYNGYVKIKPTCTDSGSGCASSRVTVTGASTNVTNQIMSEKKIEAQGESRVVYTVYDKAGNSKTCNAVDVKLDRTAPTCGVSAIKSKSKDYSNSSTYTSGEWYSGYVKVQSNCTDSGSGCTAKVTVTGASTNVTDMVTTEKKIEAEGMSTVVYKVSDKAGNSKTCSRVDVNLDRTSPELKWVSFAGTPKEWYRELNYELGGTVKFQASDNISGVNNFESMLATKKAGTVNVDCGPWKYWNDGPIGCDGKDIGATNKKTRYFRAYRAVDKAGNYSKIICSYHITDPAIKKTGTVSECKIGGSGTFMTFRADGTYNWSSS